eukprot:PhM_4_TR7631/c0_g1_i1/m.12376
MGSHLPIISGALVGIVLALVLTPTLNDQSSDQTTQNMTATSLSKSVTPDASHAVPLPPPRLPPRDVQNCGEADEWSCADFPERCAFVYLAMVFQSQLASLQPRDATKHMWMAFLSAHQLRSLHPKNPIVIITNAPEFNSRFGSHPTSFTDVVLDTRTFVAKQEHLALSKYPRNLFVDTDTLTDHDLTSAFDVLQFYDMAMVPESGWHQGIAPMLYFQVLYNDKSRMQPRYPGVGNDFPMWHHYEAQYNTGVIAYRNNECTRKFFELWHKIHISTHCKFMDIVWDQCSLPLALRKYSLRFATLSEAFNYRKAIGLVCTSQDHKTGIRLWHSKSKLMLEQINEKYGVSFISKK